MEDRKYYIYLHLRISDNKVCYVGKGHGRRSMSTHCRNRFWNFTIKKHGMYSLIYSDGLSEEEAFKKEIEIIKYFRINKLPLCNITNGGEGASGLVLTDETKEKIRKATSGLKNHFSNKKIYSFVNIKNGKEENTTPIELSAKYKLKSGISQVISERINSHCGWKLKDNIFFDKETRGINNANRNKSIYIFKNLITDETFKGTQYDFRKKYDLNHSMVSAICRGKRKKHKNWACLNVKKQNKISKEIKKKLSSKLKGELNPSFNAKIYLFVNNEGMEENCTVLYLKNKYGLSPHIYSVAKGIKKTHKGWRLSPTQ